MSDGVDLKFVDDIVAQKGAGSENVLAILQAVQTQYGYLPEDGLRRVCEITEISPAQITGVSTFYDFFRHKPAGKYTIKVCIGTACHVKGAGAVYDAFKRYLEISEDDDTDVDELFTVEKVACLGCCTLAPAVQIEDVTYGHVRSDTVDKVVEDFLRYQEAKQSQKDVAPRQSEALSQGEIRVGLVSCCIAKGTGKVYKQVEKVLANTSVNAKLKQVGCVGMCYQAPMMEIVTATGKSHLYTNVETGDVRSIILKHFKPANPLKRITNKLGGVVDKLLDDRLDESVERYPADVRDSQIADFLGLQKNIATEHLGLIDPTDIDEYKKHDGFKALEALLGDFDPECVLSEIESSGLRGRGGGGYLSYLKWRSVASADSDTKYLVCNGDEGDPGAFMDRMIMESYPYRVVEGIVIAGLTVGAKKAYLYIRSEYPVALERMHVAIEKCEEYGILGGNILSSGHSFELNIVSGAGAFVCGEETALLASIEGKRGTPALRPPYPAQKGLWQKPTLINNVETISLVPWILNNGSKAFGQLGTESSKGTKVFSLAGKVARGGLIEVPMGITLRQIVDDIGGGIGTGLKFKAVQVGGPSGGCVPAELCDVSVDYESLRGCGAIMGSGGLVVLDESDCMVDIARYFLEFTQHQSCGKCTFCRIGTKRMLEILERMCAGLGKEGDVELLLELSDMIMQSSVCGLGTTAPNPVVSTIKYFRDEYEAHIQGKCPAGKCAALIRYEITDDCIGCTLCAQHCPVDAIEITPYQKHSIDQEKCVKCGACKRVCTVNAVEIN